MKALLTTLALTAVLFTGCAAAPEANPIATGDVLLES